MHDIIDIICNVYHQFEITQWSPYLSPRLHRCASESQHLFQRSPWISAHNKIKVVIKISHQMNNRNNPHRCYVVRARTFPGFFFFHNISLGICQENFFALIRWTGRQLHKFVLNWIRAPESQKVFSRFFCITSIITRGGFGYLLCNLTITKIGGVVFYSHFPGNFTDR